MKKPVLERFWSKVEKTPTCWLWTGAKHPHGYGQFDKRGSHRVSFEFFYGPIRAGMVLDHLCRNPSCVNPKHLEQVTHRENIKRGIRFWEKCQHGDKHRQKSNRTCSECFNEKRRTLYRTLRDAGVSAQEAMRLQTAPKKAAARIENEKR